MTRLGFKPATSCVAIEYSKYLAIDQKVKPIKNWKKKKKIRLGYEPLTFRIAGGQSNHLASDMSCKMVFNKDDIRKSGDSMKME